MSDFKALSTSQKSFRIFRILDKNDQYLEKNIRIVKLNGVCFMPLVRTRDELGDIIKKFFGYNDYRKYFTNYLFDKKFVYQPYFVPGRKIISMNKEKLIVSQVDSTLPKLRNQPTFYYKNNKNSILDYTDQMNIILPTQDQLIKQNLMEYAEKIYPEIITRLGISNEDPDMFKFMAKYTSSQPQPYLAMNHNTLMIPIEVKVTDNTVVTKFLDYSVPIPRKFKKNLEYLKFISLMRYVYRGFVRDYKDLDERDPMRYFLEKLDEHNVIFFFYNKRFAFTVNYDDLWKQNIKTRQFYNMFKQKLILLISNNMGVQADAAMDALIRENEKFDENVTTNATVDLDISINKDGDVVKSEKSEPEKGNDQIVDDTEKETAKKFNSVLKNSMYKTTDTKKIQKNIKKQTDDLFKIIDKMKDRFVDIPTKEETIRPKEDISETVEKTIKVGQRIKNMNGVDVIEDVTVTKNVVADYDDEEEKEEQEEEKDINEIINDEVEEGNRDTNLDEVNLDDESSDYDDDIPEDLKETKHEKMNIEISSDGELTEEERKEILLEINKKVQVQKSDKQLRRIALVRDKYKSIKVNDDRTVEELLNDIHAVQIDNIESDVKGVLDDSVQKSTLQDFERSYIEKTMNQDLLKVFKSFDSENKTVPLHMIDYKEEDTSDRFNSKKTVTVKYEDDNQKQHTIKVDIPVPNKDGTLMINGSRKILKKQIILRPLIKINPDRLALNSFYNKVIMTRQGTVLNRKVVVIKKLIDNYFKDDDGNFFKVYYGNNIKNNKPYLTTIEYDELAKVYHKVLIGKKTARTVFFFNQNEIRKEIKDLNLEYKFSVHKLPLAIDYGNKTVIDFDMNETMTSVGDILITALKEKGGMEPNSFDEIVSAIKPPKRRIYSRVMIQSFEIPLICFLGSLFGIRNIMKLNKLKYVFTTGKLEKDDPRKNWLTVTFKDGKLYYPEYPYGNSLLFNGLNEMNTEEFYFDDFDTELPYIEYLFAKFRNRNMYKGWLGFKELFIDAITKDILRDEGLPTDFLELFLYANELLTDNSYTNETEAKSYRIRGYEILSQALYSAIAQQYNLYRQNEGKRGSISIPQNCLNSALTKSQILENYDTINPINELKMKSGCTVKGKGVGGANTNHGYNMDRRAFGEDAVGLFAESNVDNHNIGIVKELTTNPQILNTRGYLNVSKDPEKISKLKASERMAPEELIMPGIVKYDHPNRVGFSSGQWKHTLPIVGGGDPPIISSGYENTVIYQLGNTFSIKADKPGTVSDINEELEIITVKNDDGTIQTYRYGRELERNASFFLENNRVLNVKIGQKVKFNDVLAYSKEFFTKTPGGITFGVGRICKVAIMDDYFTEEDSSLITEELSDNLQTSITKKKQIKISGKSNIIKYAKIGEYVRNGDVIMQFEDARDTSSNVDITDILDLVGDPETDSSTLLYHMPKANASGEIIDINVMWVGEVEEMSETCQKFIKEYISRKKKKTSFEKQQTGEESSYAVEYKKSTPVFGMLEGQAVENGDIVIEYFIKHETKLLTADKVSLYPAIKSVTPQIVSKEYTPYTKTGKIDCVFGLVSCSARQVNTPFILGSLGKIVIDVSNDIVKEYFS